MKFPRLANMQGRAKCSRLYYQLLSERIWRKWRPLAGGRQAGNRPKAKGEPFTGVPNSLTRAICQILASISFRFHYTVVYYGKWPFEAQSRGLLARCLRFAAKVTRAPRKTRCRPAG
jgi:hypothetical protein